MNEIGQSRTGSLLESLTNTFVGFVITIAVQIVVFPWFGIFIPLSSNFAIGLIFLVVSIVRGYAIRRIFQRMDL